MSPTAANFGRGKSLGAALLLGALGVLAFAPFECWPLAFVAWGGLFALVRLAASPGRAALIGLCFGLGLYLGGVSWVYVSMHDVGGMPAPIAALAALALSAYLALFPALACAVLSRAVRRPLAPFAAALVFAALIALSEWLRGWLLTGFPWLALGYSQTPPSPLAGFAPLFGVYGVSGIAALCGALLWNAASSLVLRAHPLAIKHSCALASTLLGGWLLAGISWTQPSGAPIRVALLQGNIPQSLKWEPERLRDSLVTYLALTREHPADLTVLPETALPLLFEHLPGDYLATLRQAAAPGELLVGAPTREPGGYANSALTLGPDGQAEQRYNKAHLVPFGEYIPPGFDWFLKLMKIPMGDFYAGPDPQRPLLLAGQKVAVNICYEDLFPDQIARGAQDATVLVNLSNTAWFGHSLAQPQHLQISRMRAVETGRPMLRATNTGMTAHVTPDGRVADVLAPFTRDGLVATVTGTTGTTPYVRFGNLPALLLAVATLALALLGRRPAPPPAG
ncbi:carbon-nitrogen hydrolase/apolipoprotein N-acyltransferase [Oryzomicrobium terrae]|uniref:Apolipoprotein N-acyltransferase n=1 Tax=Oryzomicrobium terrae TaxID=1735038 RepID=A0A5C1E6H6_9RHOO|nr:apolipoprotein N-acyltransferase [Oryzomicrobium terrae]QEL63907.1 carbon-nitrogen hydrolase/apolipoprotein N-acyltransferase [Oryzomicrobium terrae]